MRRSVGLIFGGESPEHEVSLVTAQSIAQHLDPVRYEVIPIGVARNGVWTVLTRNGQTPFERLRAHEQPEKSAHPFLPLERGAENTRDRKSTRLNSSHVSESRMPSSA